VRALVSVGPKAEARLLAAARDHQGLGCASAGPVVALFGKAYGHYLYEASRDRPQLLQSEHAPKSLSAEHTFATDTRDRQVLWHQLRAQADEVAARLGQEGLLAGEVAIKLRYADWQTLTRQMKLTAPTDQADVLAAGAARLMQRHWERQRPLRLVGLRAARLRDGATPTQLSLPYSPSGP
jgi:DNA polymerase-4